MKDIIRKVHDFLGNDPLLNVTLLQSLIHDHADIVYQDDESVLLFDRPSNTMLLSAVSYESVVKCITAITEPSDFLVIQKEYADYIENHLRLHHSADYHQAVYFEQSVGIQNARLSFKLLDESDKERVRTLYKTTDFTYIENRLEQKSLWAGIGNGQITGFIGIHDEGSIGMLYVLPEFRKQGYAQELLAWMTHHYLLENKIPYSQISKDNMASIKLHKKVGYTVSHDTVVWLTR